MNLDDMRVRWEQLFNACTSPEQRAAAFDAIVSAYREPHRHYHNLDHVAACLRELDATRDYASNPRVVEMAIWFHDAVYDPTRGDNEERSAELAERALARLDVGDDTRRTVGDLVRATDHARDPRSSNEALLLDIDLSILGQPPEAFDAYERAIRAEYSHVPDAEFAAGRAAVLRKFLQRKDIYFTDVFRQRFERGAGQNLARAIETWQRAAAAVTGAG